MSSTGSSMLMYELCCEVASYIVVGDKVACWIVDVAGVLRVLWCTKGSVVYS